MARCILALWLQLMLLQAVRGRSQESPVADDGHCASEASDAASEAGQGHALLQAQRATSRDREVPKEVMSTRRHPPAAGLQVHSAVEVAPEEGHVTSGTKNKETRALVEAGEEDEGRDSLEAEDEDEGHDTQGPGFFEDMNEAGYQATAATCCNYQMEEFVRRVIDDLGLELCGEGGLMGLVPYYTCDHGIQDYTTLRKDILEQATGECPIAALPGSCPANTDNCPGEPDPDYHRRRNCRSASSSQTTTVTVTGPTTTTIEETTITTTTKTTTTVTTTVTTVSTTTRTTTTRTTTTKEVVTTTTVPTTTTTSTGCKGEDVLLDIFNSKMVNSNLGGAGPDEGATNMRYEGAGFFEGKPFDIVVEATSAYTATNNLQNGFECGLPAQGCNTGHFGQIDLAAGTSVDLTISFQDSATQEPVTLSRFLFSIHDIDNFESSIEEIVYISGFADDAILSSGTEVDSTEEGGRTKLTAKQEGTACDDPENPMRLAEKVCDGATIDQRKRSAAFVFADTSSISLTLEATCDGCPAGSGRTFLFSGDTNLVTCAGKGA